MEKLGVDYFRFRASGKKPLESINRFLPEKNKILLVHNTYSEKEDIEYAERTFDNITWCFCPNANLYIENKLPRIELFRKNEVKITIGTDSFASNHQLSILEELKTISRFFPEIPLNVFLKWATLNGAEFFQIENTFGSFENGKIPGINLISNLSPGENKLTVESKVRVIKSA